LAAIANDFETVVDNFRPEKPLTSACRLLSRRLVCVFVTLLQTISRCRGGWPPRTSKAVETKEVIPVWLVAVCLRI
jgi:hypothetical protein